MSKRGGRLRGCGLIRHKLLVNGIACEKAPARVMFAAVGGGDTRVTPPLSRLVLLIVLSLSFWRGGLSLASALPCKRLPGTSSMAFQDPVVGGTISNAKPFQLVDNLDLACATPVWILSCSRWDGFSQSLRFDDYSEKHLIWGRGRIRSGKLRHGWQRTDENL
jgi:hypothetical protein